MNIPLQATRKDLRRIIEKQAAQLQEQSTEIQELREQAEIAQESGVREGLFDPEEAVLPWQDFESTVKRLESLQD